MLGCAGQYLANRKVLHATDPLLSEAVTAQEKSPTRVSCKKGVAAEAYSENLQQGLS